MKRAAAVSLAILLFGAIVPSSAGAARAARELDIEECHEQQAGIQIPREQALYEHELRHTNQYQWLGPYFHLGLPLWGVYEWEVILHGYKDAWQETDARAHSWEY